MDDKKLLMKNSISGVFQLIITAVLTFLCVPVLIAKLGLEMYGVFAVFSVISNLSMLADLGMDRTLIVYLSNQGRCRESGYDILVALFIKFLLLILFLGLAWLFSDFILLHVLAIPIKCYDESISFYHSILFSNIFMILGMTFASVLDALQKIYLNSLFRLFYSILYWGGLLLIALSDFGLMEMGYISVLSTVIWFICTVFSALNDWGGISLIGVIDNFVPILKKQISYSAKIFSASLLNLFFEPLSKILISNFIGLDYVALFDIALRIRGQIASLFSKAIYPLGPYVANTLNTKFLLEMLKDITRKIHLVVILVTVVLVFTSKILIYLWIGNVSDIDDLSLYVLVLCGSFLLFVPPTYPIYQYLYTRLLAAKTIYIQSVNVLVNLILFLLLFKWCGIYTILISNSIAYFCSYLLSMHYLDRYLGTISGGLFYYKLCMLFSLLFIGGLMCFFLHDFGFIDLLIYPLILFPLFVVLVRSLKLLTKADICRYFHSYPKIERGLLLFF